MKRLLATVAVSLLIGCAEPPEWVQDAATATSVGDAGQCQLDDWAGLPFVLFDDVTTYAKGYSDDRFCTLRVGMTREEVFHRLGEPLSEIWEFPDPNDETGYALVIFESGEVTHQYPGETPLRGWSRSEVEQMCGAPREVTLNYSGKSEDTHYRQRSLTLQRDRVTDILGGVYVD
jgi:hypothetical protein